MLDMRFCTEDISPRDLSINLRFKGKTVVHPRAKAAQAAIAAIVKEQVKAGYDPCSACHLELSFFFPSARSDVDGPVKRVMDAIERGIKDAGVSWNDWRVYTLKAEKHTAPPGDDGYLCIYMRPAYPGTI